MEKPTSKKIEEDLREKIRVGDYEADSPLLSVNELCARYSTSRLTVQKALSALVADKVIYSIPGKGYFVTGASDNEYRFRYDVSGMKCEGLGAVIIPPPPLVIYYLHVHPDKEVVRVRRRYLSEGKPAILEEFFFPYVDYAPLPGIDDTASVLDLVSHLTSLYDAKRIMSIRIDRAEGEPCAALELPDGSPVVLVEQTIVNEENDAVGWSVAFGRSAAWII